MAYSFDKYLNSSDYGWLPKLHRASAVADSERKMSEWGTDYLGGQQIGGLIGGLLGQYGLPYMTGITEGAKGAGMGALGSTIGSALGGGIAGGIWAGDKPHVDFAQGSMVDLSEKLRGANTLGALTGGMGVINNAYAQGLDEYEKHVLDVGDTAYKKAGDLRNLEGPTGLLKWMMPGGESGAYEGNRMILNPDYEVPQIMDMDNQSKTFGQMIDDPNAPAPTMDDYILDKDFYKGQGLRGKTRRELDLEAGAGLLSGFEDETLMKEQYQDLVNRGIIRPEYDNTMPGSPDAWDYQMDEDQLSGIMPQSGGDLDAWRPSDWASRSADEQEQWLGNWETATPEAKQQMWTEDFRTWEDALLTGTPESSFIYRADASEDKGRWYNPFDTTYDYTYGRTPQTSTQSGFPVWNEETQKWEL